MIPDPAPPFEVDASGLIRDRIRRRGYSVHDRIPTVVMTNLFPLPGNPLYGESFDG